MRLKREFRLRNLLIPKIQQKLTRQGERQCTLALARQARAAVGLFLIDRGNTIIMQRTTGISFSNNHCHLTQLSRENGKLSLTDVTYFHYEQDLLNALRANVNTIQSFLSNSKQVILALPSQDVLLKNITVDAALTDEEIICHIQSQSSVLFGYAFTQLCFDYETYSIEENNRHIIIAACHQQKILAYQHCFDQLKMSLNVIDVDVFSLSRLMLFLKNNLIDLTLPTITEHLQTDFFNPDLKINLDKLGLSLSAEISHHPLFISMGASLWGEA